MPLFSKIGEAALCLGSQGFLWKYNIQYKSHQIQPLKPVSIFNTSFLIKAKKKKSLNETSNQKYWPSLGLQLELTSSGSQPSVLHTVVLSQCTDAARGRSRRAKAINGRGKRFACILTVGARLWGIPWVGRRDASVTIPCTTKPFKGMRGSRGLRGSVNLLQPLFLHPRTG